MESTLYLIRHGSTEANLQNPPTLQGKHRDLPLSPWGLIEVKALAETLSACPIDAIYTSPLLRARQTAEALAALTSRVPVAVEALHEIDAGIWDGCTWAEIAQKYPNEYQAFQDDPGAAGYLGGENMSQVVDRALPVVEEMARRHRGGGWAVVSHNAVNRALLAHWMGIPLKICRRLPQDNACFNVVSVGETAVRVRTVNSIHHLSGLVMDE